MNPQMFDSWDDFWSCLKFIGTGFALVVCITAVVVAPIVLMGAHSEDVNRQACERRGGRWIVTGSNDHDGEIRTCLDEGGHVR